MPGASVFEKNRVLVYENVRDVVFLLAVEGDRFRFVEINPAFTSATGLAEAQVVGKLVDEVIPEPSLSLVLESYRAACREQRTVRWEEVSEYPSGTKHGQVSVTPVVDADGRCTHLVGTVHDVTAEARGRALAGAEQAVLEMAASGAPLQSSLEVLALAMERQVPSALISILLVDPDGTRLRHGAAPSLPAEVSRVVDGAAVGPTQGSCGAAVALGHEIVAVDIETDERWGPWRDLARSHGLRACWSTPILSRDARVLGTFALYYREPRVPAQEDRDLVARAVHVAGIAIQRHELDEQLRGLSARLDAAREEERTGIAREIHDQLGQSLAVLKMDLAFIARRGASPAGITTAELLAKVSELSGLTDEIIRQVRRISAELRPGVLDDLGLAAALGWQAQEFEKRTGVICAVDVRVGPESLARSLSTTVFRAVQEALTNVALHAEASRVDILLREDAGDLLLDVSDDGKGIRPEDVRDPRSLGLLGMSERARREGGSVTFDRGARSGSSGPGTTVAFRLPLRRGSTAPQPK